MDEVTTAGSNCCASSRASWNSRVSIRRTRTGGAHLRDASCASRGPDHVHAEAARPLDDRADGQVQHARRGERPARRARTHRRPRPVGAREESLRLSPRSRCHRFAGQRQHDLGDGIATAQLPEWSTRCYPAFMGDVESELVRAATRASGSKSSDSPRRRGGGGGKWTFMLGGLAVIAFATSVGTEAGRTLWQRITGHSGSNDPDSENCPGSKWKGDNVVIDRHTPSTEYPSLGLHQVQGTWPEVDKTRRTIELPAICWAARFGKVDVVKWYLDHAGGDKLRCANVQAEYSGELGFTPLHYAARAETPCTEDAAVEIIDMLVAAGAELGAQDRIEIKELGAPRGETPLHSACEYARAKPAAALLGHIVKQHRCDLLTLAAPGVRPDVGRPLGIVAASLRATQDPKVHESIRNAILSAIDLCGK